MNRKTRKKEFEKLEKTVIPGIRFDHFGMEICLYEYGKKTEHGCVIQNGRLIHWRNAR